MAILIATYDKVKFTRKKSTINTDVPNKIVIIKC